MPSSRLHRAGFASRSLPVTAPSATTKSPASANHPNIYMISSFTRNNDGWSIFSNYVNPPVDFAEPGSAIPSTYKDGG